VVITFLPVAAAFILVVIRCASLFSVVPLFGMPAIPARVRMAAAVSVSVAAFLGAGAPSFAAWDHADRFIMAALTETLLGLTAGLAARLVLDAAAAAGSAIGVSMGLSVAATYDPIHGAESTAVSQVLSLLALGFAVAGGIHREAVAWLCRSLVDMPPGSPVAFSDLAARVVGQAVGAIALAIRLAFPVLTAVTIGHLSLGLLNRTTPQLGLSNIGFSVALLAGAGALYLAAPPAALLAAEAARSALAGR
jgi:flagellar biosynthetic protein FliR